MDKKDAKEKLKEMEEAVLKIKFYPIAVSYEDKEKAKKRLKKLYKKGNSTDRQLIVYLLHNLLCGAQEFKLFHSIPYFQAKGVEPKNIQMKIYRSIFNYYTSIEGALEVIKFLGELGGVEAAKLLTYHFTRYSQQESESNHVLRNAIIEALGECEDAYALRALLDYAKYVGEPTIHFVYSALEKWNERVKKIKNKKERKELQEALEELLSKEPSSGGGSHYG